jgi:hypothetical protein
MNPKYTVGREMARIWNQSMLAIKSGHMRIRNQETKDIKMFIKRAGVRVNWNRKRER